MFNAKRLLLALVLGLFFTQPLQAAFVHVATTTETTDTYSTDATVAVTIPATTIGNLVVVVANMASGTTGGVVNSITCGGTFSEIQSIKSGTGNNYIFAYAAVATSSVTSCTVVLNINGDGSMPDSTTVMEFSGPLSPYAESGTSLSADNASTTTHTAGGSNPGMLNVEQRYGGGGTPGADTEVYFLLIQNNIFNSGDGEIGGTKLYSTFKAVEENNEFIDLGTNTHSVDWKSDHKQFTSRGSKYTGYGRRGLGGNMHGSSGATYGEVYFNMFGAVNDTSQFNYGCIMLNEDSELGQKRTGNPGVLETPAQAGTGTYIYRNTCAGNGRVVLWNFDANDGLVEAYANVLVNANNGASPFDGFYWANAGAASGSWTGTADTSRVTVSNNLTESSATGILDGDGNLIGDSLTNHGPNSATPKGHMLGAGGGGGSSTGARGKGRMRMRGK